MSNKDSICDIEEPVETLKMTIYDECIDLSVNVAEIGIDQLFESDLLKDIPVIGSLYGLGKTAKNLKDLFLIKKILVFNQQLRSGTANKEIVKKHKKKINEKPNLARKEMEVILAYLDKHIKYTKSMILANFYLLYIDDEIEFDWEDFELMAEIVNDISLYDIKTLGDLYIKKNYTENDECNYLSAKRLNSSGLIDYYGGMSMSRPSQEGAFVARINQIGELFWEHGMKGINTKLTIDGEEITL
jgi:hypothetical protein